ncbi:MAG: DUF2065 domain-containing protein [Xanthomonadales bacterium]|nr:hypothetical protein [Xanthomonadales bacterium]MCC6591908.1 DUF2065 domain-containing protein [Xanthomonadales bacterium]MCE7930050.1 DUF2065 domain-containing protein [Xanthomonadales bacterium PRO6]
MNDLWAALALLLVFEGILPFLAPAQWKEAVRRIARMEDTILRWIGLICMLLGLALLILVRGH